MELPVHAVDVRPLESTVFVMALRLAACRVLVVPHHFSHVRVTKAALYYASLSQKN